MAKDRFIKGPAYAAAGIREYWIINLPDRQIEQYLNPAGQQYQQTNIYKTGQVVESKLMGKVLVNNILP